MTSTHPGTALGEETTGRATALSRPRIGAVHLGWNLLAVAAGGGGRPIRPLEVEGTYTPHAYLLADADGRLHTGADVERAGLGLGVADVREILDYPEVLIAGATWPTPEVFRARLYNPLTEICGYLGGPVDLVALPYPHDWSDEKLDRYCELVSRLGVEVEPVPESVALADYVRATEFDGADTRSGLTAVYCDGRTALVVAVHVDPDRPTESVDVPVAKAARTDPGTADRLVYDIMAAARSVQAETSPTVVLTGSVCFDESIRLAFRNHLGPRLRLTSHPVHAVALGAADLIATELLEQRAAQAGVEIRTAAHRPEPASPPPEAETPEPAEQERQPAEPESRTADDEPPASEPAPPAPPKAKAPSSRKTRPASRKSGSAAADSAASENSAGRTRNSEPVPEAEPGAAASEPPEPALPDPALPEAQSPVPEAAAAPPGPDSDPERQTPAAAQPDPSAPEREEPEDGIGSAAADPDEPSDPEPASELGHAEPVREPVPQRAPAQPADDPGAAARLGVRLRRRPRLWWLVLAALVL
ncbi:MAG: hypothetical protein HOQ24_14940, partial [Mycobacteriaceae bacterium]|nr:hypothetical protein [Mycobacteriaceae bacterium]